MFDHVYIVAAGQCVYQGYGGHIVKFLKGIDLTCPLHYNPADFGITKPKCMCLVCIFYYIFIFFTVIEVSSGEYGDHIEKMVAAVDNGRLERWEPPPGDEPEVQTTSVNQPIINYDPTESLLELEPEPVMSRTHQYKYTSSAWDQFKVLIYRMMLQHWRNSVCRNNCCFDFLVFK